MTPFMEIFDELIEQAELYKDPSKTVPDMTELDRFLSLLARFLYASLAASTAGKKDEWTTQERSLLENSQKGLLWSAYKYYLLRSKAEDNTPQEKYIFNKIKTLRTQVARVVGQDIEGDPTEAASPPPEAPSQEHPTQQ